MILIYMAFSLIESNYTFECFLTKLYCILLFFTFYPLLKTITNLVPAHMSQLQASVLQCCSAAVWCQVNLKTPHCNQSCFKSNFCEDQGGQP